VVASTRIQTPEQAEEILARGDADLVGLCRALLVDPDWPAKAAAGRAEAIRRCIACNQCWGWITDGQPISCVHNATAGREAELGPLAPAERRRRVLVVGGGPAGLEAARVAAERGHAVTLLERAVALGGRIREAAVVPGHEEVGNVLGFLIPEVERLGVEVRLGAEATAGTVARERPEAVVVATGATPVAPPLPSDGSVPILPGAGPAEAAALAGRRVVVMDEDGYFWAAATTELLAQAGARVTLVTRFFEVLRELPAVSRIATLRALDQLGVELRPNMAVGRVEAGGVILTHYYSAREEYVPEVAALVWLGPQRANSELADELRGQGIEVHLVGDAFAPRRLANAIQEGHRAGRAL
jgi:2,4-dienoyl-CoA reductase (NADPH2)